MRFSRKGVERGHRDRSPVRGQHAAVGKEPTQDRPHSDGCGTRGNTTRPRPTRAGRGRYAAPAAAAGGLYFTILAQKSVRSYLGVCVTNSSTTLSTLSFVTSTPGIM